MLHKNTNLTLYIVRHGESEINLERNLVVGQSHESPLTPKGEKQAAKLGLTLKRKRIKFDFVYSSSSMRAYQTAQITTEKIGFDPDEIKKDDRIVEYSVGDWAGGKRDEIYTSEVTKSMNLMGPYFTPPKGESLVMVQRRVMQWLFDEIIYNENYIGKTLDIGVFTHSMIIRVLLHYIMGFNDRLIYRIKINNTGLSIVRFTEAGWYVDGVNL